MTLLEGEVPIRSTSIQNSFKTAITLTFDEANWCGPDGDVKTWTFPELSIQASKSPGMCLTRRPLLKNELLNRHRPSSSAVAAQNSLLKRMVSNADKENLDIDTETYSAERGLYVSLEQKLHRKQAKTNA